MSTPYMTAPEAALYLCFRHDDGSPNVRAFYHWRERNHGKLPAYRRGGGRVLLFRKVDVELALEKEGAARDAFLRRVR